MTDLDSLYRELRFWLPMITAFGLVIKGYLSAKANVSGWMEKLLDNHLVHIEEATVSTHEATKQTNVLLTESAGKLDMLQATVSDHNEKDLQVWAAVTQNLTILRERTRACNPSRKASAKRKK